MTKNWRKMQKIGKIKASASTFGLLGSSKICTGYENITTGWLGSLEKFFGSGRVGQNILGSGQISGRFLTQPILEPISYSYDRTLNLPNIKKAPTFKLSLKKFSGLKTYKPNREPLPAPNPKILESEHVRICPTKH